MRPDEIDRILSHKTEIVPSSGFTHSVMAAVRAESAESMVPRPIPFPWIRALPGLAVLVGAIVWAVTESVRLPSLEPAGGWVSGLWDGSVSSLWELSDRFAPMLLTKAEMLGAGWVLLAIAITGACLKLSMHLVHRRV